MPFVGRKSDRQLAKTAPWIYVSAEQLENAIASDLFRCAIIRIIIAN